MKTRTFRAAKAAGVAAAVAGLAAIVAGLGTPALAWNKPGHMVSGAIAYQEPRRTNRQVLGRIVAVLKQHPDYERLWRARVEDAQASGIDEAEALLMQAARWPDDVKVSSAWSGRLALRQPALRTSGRTRAGAGSRHHPVRLSNES